MISLHSMTIQGIRSFGPHLEDQQKIRFNSPVTMVLGQNGCGKTTIIESIKFCLTGELPPSTSGSKGGSFIHDPKIAELCEVRGNIKLKVKISKDDCLTISRSAQVTQKAKTLTYKTIDCSITFGNEDDKKQASKKCINVEQEVCRIFGVSKAILNYVIFCHQEESYWPLEEPKKVKEKFDAIFNTTRYNKALDELIKTRKKFQSDINNLMIELKGLEKMKTIVDDKKLKILQMEEKLKECEIKIKELSYSVNPIELELKKVKVKELELSEIHGKRESKKTLCFSLQKQLEELELAIKGAYEGNSEELEEEIKQYDDQFNNKNENLDKIKFELIQYNVKEETLSRRINQEQNRLGQLQSEEDQHQSRIDNLKAIIVTLSNDLNIYFSQDEFNIEQKIDNIKLNFQKLKDDYLKKKKEFEESEKVVEEKIYSLRDFKVQIEQNITSKSRQIAENKQDVKKIQNELNQIEQASSGLTRLEQKIEKVKNELKETTDSEDIESLKSKIKSLENISAEKEMELEKIYKEVETLQQQNSIQIEYDNLKENKTVKESDIKKMKNKHFANIKRLLKIEDFPEQGIKFLFKNFMDTLSNDIIKKNNILKQKQKDLLILENNRKHLKEKIQDVENDLKAKEESIYDTYGNEDFNETLTNLNTTIENLQDQKGTLTSSDIMFRRYVEKLKSSDPCCPLCQRDFSNEADVTELIYELENKVKEAPTKIKNNKEELETLQEKYKNMLKMQPTVETIKDIKQNNLPSQKSKLKEIETNIDKLKSEIHELNLELQSPISDEELAKNMLGDIVILDQHLMDLKKFSREMEKLESQLTIAGERNLKQALTHQESLRNDSSNNRQQLSLLNSRLNKYIVLVNELNEKLNSLVKDQLVIQGNAQKRDQYISRLSELEKTISKLTKEHTEISEKLTPAKEDLENTTSNREQMNKEHKKILEKDSQKIDDLKIRLNEVNRITINIDDYNKVHNAGTISSLEEVKNQIEKLEKERKTILEKKLELSNLIKEQSKFISNQELRLRELKDIKKQRTLKKEVKELDEEIQILREKLIKMNHDSIQKEKKKLMAERDQIDRDSARMQGSKKEMQISLNDLNEEISKPDFKYADKNYYDKLIKLKIRELACDDFHKCYNGLDWALQQFHKRKMEQVNAIIKDMWRDIYRGNDIDYIQIKTEDEDVKDITKKRTFTYGVVQHRDRAILEMRGRCSAGQKMLACLIIRMALAQTFSSNCGIMTLDEPTTNLDRENIKAMCENLADLLSSEHAKNNLQFVIITHDDKFLEELRRLDSLDTYYRVARNHRGLSTLSRQRI